MTAPTESNSRDVEYVQTIAYIHHMYDTRRHIFQFVIGLNTAMLAVVFQFLTTDIAKSSLSILGGLVTLALALMAKRSLAYLDEVERYGQELEERLGFRLLRDTSARMPKGIDSSVYLLIIYWLLIAIWTVLGIYHILRLFGLNLPQL